MQTATYQSIPPTALSASPTGAQFYQVDELVESSLEPLHGAMLTPGGDPSGPSDTKTITPISTQDQESITSNPVVTVPQSPVNPVTHNSLTQSSSSVLPQTSTSSSSVVSVTQLPNNPVAQSTSSIENQASSDKILPSLMPQLPSFPRVQATSSTTHQIGSSSSSSSSPAIAVSQNLNSPISQFSSSIKHEAISTNNISPIPASQLPDTSRVQSTSSSSTLANAVTPLPNHPMSQTPSSINQQSSSSFNTDTPPSQLQQLSFNTVIHVIPSMGYQTSSSSNSNPSQTLLSDSMVTDHPPTPIFPTITLDLLTSPLAIQTIAPEATTSSAVGLANAMLAGMSIVPPEASTTPDKGTNGGLESGGNGVEVVQIFPTATLIVSIVSSVPTAATSTVQGPVVTISASMGIIAPGTSAIQNGWGNGSRVATGNGNPTESVPGHTNVSTVFTGGAEGVNGWSNWLLGFGILVWDVAMIFWL